jgi:hypothetical protein
MPAGRPKQMSDRKATIVYLDKPERDHYQTIADREGTSISAVCRRVLKQAMTG